MYSGRLGSCQNRINEQKKRKKKNQQQLASKINKAIFTNRNRSVCISVHLSIGGGFFAIPYVYIYVRVFFMMSLGYSSYFSKIFICSVICEHCDLRALLTTLFSGQCAPQNKFTAPMQYQWTNTLALALTLFVARALTLHCVSHKFERFSAKTPFCGK